MDSSILQEEPAKSRIKRSLGPISSSFSVKQKNKQKKIVDAEIKFNYRGSTGLNSSDGLDVSLQF